VPRSVTVAPVFWCLQARAVIDGLPADMVALALPLDVQKIADAGLLSANWAKGFPLGSVGESARLTK
jgi:ABC-type sulfate transport system substrate-binding protein